MLTGSTTDLCNLLEINKSTLTAWKKLGLDAYIDRNQWDMTRAIQWWAENINTQREITDPTLKDEERRYKTAKADKMEIEVDKMRFDLLPRDQVEAAIAEAIAIVKKGLILLAKTLPTILHGLDPVEMRKRMEMAVDELLLGFKDGLSMRKIEENIRALAR